MDAHIESNKHCPTCKEKHFGKSFSRNSPNVCKDCKKSYKDKGHCAMTACNTLDPYPQGCPFHLPRLMPTEEMMIASAHVVMKSYRLSDNGALGCRGSIFNLEQDPSNLIIAMQLPWRPDQLPALILRKVHEALPNGYKDFQCRRGAITHWLEYLRQNFDKHAELPIDAELLRMLPKNGSIVHLLRQIIEQDAPVNNSQGGNTNGNDQNEDDDDVGPQNQQELGPAQGGTSGAPAEENQVEEMHFGRPLQPNEQQMKALLDSLKERFGGTEEHPAEFPQAGAPLSDCNTPGIQAMAFPMLFPHGVGDVTNKDHRSEVTMMEANKHLTKCAIWDEEEKKYFCPFVEHPRWCYWACDTAARHRLNGQKSVFMKKSPEDANMSEDDLRKIIREGGEPLERLLGRMQACNANINGSNACLCQRRIELEALMEQEGMSSMWCSLSMADNHWDDLHRALDPEARDFENEKERAKFKCKMSRNNPHLVDAFFFQ